MLWRCLACTLMDGLKSAVEIYMRTKINWLFETKIMNWLNKHLDATHDVKGIVFGSL